MCLVMRYWMNILIWVGIFDLIHLILKLLNHLTPLLLFLRWSLLGLKKV